MSREVVGLTGEGVILDRKARLRPATCADCAEPACQELAGRLLCRVCVELRQRKAR